MGWPISWRTWVGSTWLWFGMLNHLAQLLSHSCQFLISPVRTRQSVEDHKTKSIPPRTPGGGPLSASVNSFFPGFRVAWLPINNLDSSCSPNYVNFKKELLTIQISNQYFLFLFQARREPSGGGRVRGRLHLRQAVRIAPMAGEEGILHTYKIFWREIQKN